MINDIYGHIDLLHTVLFATQQSANVSNGANENDSLLTLTPF